MWHFTFLKKNAGEEMNDRKYVMTHNIEDETFIFVFAQNTAARLCVNFWLMAVDPELPCFTAEDARQLSAMVREIEGGKMPWDDHR